ncbi:MAG: amino acid adenylation domain-containing protein, partial [bacterium]|nr:amino acid adenylation domain-containing protein [bacterium]
EVRNNIPVEYKQRSLNWEIGTMGTANLRKIAQTNGTTLNLVLQTMWGLLLMKYNNCRDVVFGAVVSGRPAGIEGIEKMIGLFINTVPVRVTATGQQEFLQMLKKLHRKTAKSNTYEYHSLAAIQAGSALKGSLFDHIMIFENYPVAEEIKQSTSERGLPFKIKTMEVKEQTNYYFNIIIAPGKSTKIEFSYNTAIYDDHYVESIKHHFIKIITQVTENPRIHLKDIRIITEKEKKQLLYEFNDTTVDYPENKTLQQLFEEQVEKTPDNIGVVANEEPVGKEKTQEQLPQIGPEPAVGGIHESPLHPPFTNKSHPSTLSTLSTPSTPSTHKAPLQEPQSRQTHAVTYRELNKKSSQLASLLKSKGVEPGAIVAIMVERSLEMIVGLLGILKAGAAYLPIDPAYPQERIHYMLKDSNAGIVLKEFYEIQELNELKESEKCAELGESIEIIDINIINRQLPSTAPQYQPSGIQPPSFPNNQYPLTNPLAYIIYTSGSTGRPKGVMVEQRSVVNILAALQREYPLKGDDTYLLKTSYIFDVSVTEIFGWTIGGGRLAILARNAEKDPRQIIEAARKHRVTHINFVPSMFGIFVEELGTSPRDLGGLAALRYIFLAGEALSPALVERYRRIDPEGRIRLENIYGPTEATIYATRYPLEEWQKGGRARGRDHVSRGKSNTVPIGKPMGNVTLYIFDKYDNMQPVGVPGELIISGTGLARGYLNRPELTAERFANYKLQTTNYKQTTNNKLQITNKKQKAKKEIIKENKKEIALPNNQYPITNNTLYHTGDLARWLPDGNIEFLGRMDHQVKIRGYRIELGEIENSILKYPGIKETVVLSRQLKSGDNILCAYYVQAGKEEAEPDLRQYLAHGLPDYMIPSFFIKLEKIPLTTTGKINRSALSEHPISNIRSQTHEPPRNDIEEKLVEIWGEVLEIPKDKISIDENFFHIGGHSLRAVAMITRLHKAFNVKLPLAGIFKTPSIRALSDTIKGLTKTKYAS